jgi:lipopolysaccharide biosynthesis glycosyltransferase
MPSQRTAAINSLVVVTACDENYSHAAAAAMRSVIDSLPPDQHLRLFVLNGGISPGTRERLRRSWNRRRVEVGWLEPDFDAIRELPVSGHVSIATYLRILQAELLPADVTKAIYLDADTVTVRDLSQLWSVELNGSYCAAVQDAFLPFLNPHEALDHPIHCMTLPGVSPFPIPNYRELGMSGRSAYFNAGVMVVNVERWRHERVAEQCLDCLRLHSAHVRYWDQYALNVVLANDWTHLDPRWNQNSHVLRVPNWKLSHYSESELQQVRRVPWIIHFDAKPKPWEEDSRHPFRQVFFRHLDRTAWRGWRPPQSIRQRIHRLYLDYQTWRRSHLSPVIRHWKNRLLGRHRKAL